MPMASLIGLVSAEDYQAANLFTGIALVANHTDSAVPAVRRHGPAQHVPSVPSKNPESASGSNNDAPIVAASEHTPAIALHAGVTRSSARTGDS